MRIKNTCNKIIAFGKIALLPNEIIEVPKEFEGNPVLDAYVEMDNIVILKDVPKVEEVKQDENKIPENFEKLKKAELVALCDKFGIEYDEENTKSEIVQKIKDYLR